MRLGPLPLAFVLAACGGGPGGLPFDKVEGLASTEIALRVFAASKDAVYLNTAIGGLMKRSGTTWQKVSLPSGLSVGAVWGPSPTDLWGAGGSVVSRSSDGQTWAKFADLASQGVTSIADLHGCSADEVWVIDEIQGFAVRWNGTSWTRFLSQQSNATRVYCAAPGDVWVLGPFGASRFQNGAFKEVTLPSGGEAAAISGTGPSDLWIVGGNESVLHFDGTGFTEVSIPIGHGFTGVYAAAKDDVWAAGLIGTTGHYDGAKWTRTDTGLGYQQSFNWVHGSAKDDVWMVGSQGSVLHKQH